jgi:hypothetical protein
MYITEPVRARFLCVCFGQVKSDARPDQLTAFTRCRHEALPIEYGDLPSAALNQTGMFHAPDGIGDSWLRNAAKGTRHRQGPLAYDFEQIVRLPQSPIRGYATRAHAQESRNSAETGASACARALTGNRCFRQAAPPPYRSLETGNSLFPLDNTLRPFRLRPLMCQI